MYSDEQIYECKEREEMPFLKNQNINMLFDIILEAEIIQSNDVNEIKRILIDKMDKYIRKNSYQGKSLIQINKEFINSLLQPQKQEQDKYNDDRVIFTIEDIQADRMDTFQKNVERKKLEFQDAVNIKIPEPPKFSDDIDKPIKEIESLISKTIAERNFEIEKIHQGVNQKQVEQFLKSQETSLKNNKNISPNNQNQNIKLIKIEKTDIKPEPLDVIELISESKEERNSIFSKLKMIPGSNQPDSLNSFNEKLINQPNDLKNPASMDDIFYLSKKLDALEEKIDRLLKSQK